MTYEVNGLKGRYDGKVTDDSVKYGRNAVDNNIKQMQAPLLNDNFATPPIFDFSPNSEAGEKNLKALEKFVDDNDAYLKSLPPLEYEYRYMPTGKVDPKAVLGAAYEEFGGEKEISVKEFEKRYLIDDSQTAEPMDINKDGKIDIAEYGANIMAADVLSKGTTDVSKIDGTINSQGLNAVMQYSLKANSAAATKLYSSIYNAYNLGSALNQI